eukprot:gene7906-9729_t
MAFVSANETSNYKCPMVNKCEKVKDWQESGQLVSQFNCKLYNNGPTPVNLVTINLDGAKVKEVWELETKNHGLSWDLVQWRKGNPIQTGQYHSWGYNVYGGNALKVNECGTLPPKPVYSRKLAQEEDSGSCILENSCTQSNQWNSGGDVYTQYSCQIKNKGSIPVNHMNLQFQDNAGLFNVWEITTDNAGHSWDFVEWRYGTPLKSGETHSWGYILKGTKPLPITVKCAGAPPTTTGGSTTGGSTTGGSTTGGNPCKEPSYAQEKLSSWSEGGKDYSKHSVVVKNDGTQPLYSVIFYADMKLLSVWDAVEVDPARAPRNYEIIKQGTSLAPGSSTKWVYVVEGSKQAPLNIVSKDCTKL